MEERSKYLIAGIVIGVVLGVVIMYLMMDLRLLGAFGGRFPRSGNFSNFTNFTRPPGGG